MSRIQYLELWGLYLISGVCLFYLSGTGVASFLPDSVLIDLEQRIKHKVGLPLEVIFCLRATNKADLFFQVEYSPVPKKISVNDVVIKPMSQIPYGKLSPCPKQEFPFISGMFQYSFSPAGNCLNHEANLERKKLWNSFFLADVLPKPALLGLQRYP